MRTLVSDSFAVPERLDTDTFTIRALSMHDVIRDYDAVMTSVDHLHRTFAYAQHHSVFGGLWPPSELSIEEELADLGWHQTEFKKRYSFTYSVVSRDGDVCLGCVYILPGEKSGADVEVYLWVRQSAIADNLDARLFSIVRQWIKDVWPFESVAYPGRM